MTRNLKALGVIAAAALMMSAVFASAAQAETPKEFKSGETPDNHTESNLHGVQEGTPGVNNFFQVTHATEGPKITCTNSGVTFAGNTDTDGTNSILTMTPTYEECWQLGTTRNATVTVNGCDYTFLQPTEEGGQITGEAELYCPANNEIEVAVFAADGVEAHTGAHGGFRVCTIRIKPVNENTEQITEQKLGGHVIYTNLEKHVNEKDAVTAYATIEKIYWEKEGLCGNAEGHDGTYENTVTVTGSSGEKAHDVWVG